MKTRGKKTKNRTERDRQRVAERQRYSATRDQNTNTR